MPKPPMKGGKRDRIASCHSSLHYSTQFPISVAMAKASPPTGAPAKVTALKGQKCFIACSIFFPGLFPI